MTMIPPTTPPTMAPTWASLLTTTVTVADVPCVFDVTATDELPRPEVIIVGDVVVVEVTPSEVCDTLEGDVDDDEDVDVAVVYRGEEVVEGDVDVVEVEVDELDEEEEETELTLDTIVN
jgi:hypothetical protein